MDADSTAGQEAANAPAIHATTGSRPGSGPGRVVPWPGRAGIAPTASPVREVDLPLDLPAAAPAPPGLPPVQHAPQDEPDRPAPSPDGAAGPAPGGLRPQPPAPVPAQGPATALHDDRLWLLARRGQGAVLCLDFELHTRLVRQMFRRDFAYVSRQMLGLEASRRVHGLDRIALDEALRTVRLRHDELQARFRLMAAELDALPVACGVAPAALSAAPPVRLRATVLSPSTRRFIELLQAADQVVCRVEHGWLLGALPAARRTALVGECRRALAGFKELVSERRQAIGGLVRQVNANRGSHQALPTLPALSATPASATCAVPPE